MGWSWSLSDFFRNKYRKIIHFSLIFCLLIIQVLIGGYFYNEFLSQRKLSIMENRLTTLRALEMLTDKSKSELMDAQGHLQKYVVNKDKSQLKAYFTALDSVAENLRTLEKNKDSNLKVPADIAARNLDIVSYKKLIDSTYKTKINDEPKNKEIQIPNIEKFVRPDLNFDKYNVETKVYTDSVKKKKNLFGRIGDAIKGKESVRRDSVVVRIKPGATTNSQELKAEFDSVITAIQNYYSGEFKRVQVDVRHQQMVVRNDSNFYEIFGSLLDSSNRLIGVYDGAVKNTKADLMADYNRQTSKSNKIRTGLVLAAMALMLVVSVLILMLTRLAFLYEKRLDNANRQIEENLNFKTRILGMLSHEMRSPLKIVDIFIKRINKKTDNEEIKDYLKSISFTNNSLLMQAEQILEYTKNQYADNQLVPVSFNLKAEIDNILRAIKPYVESRNNQFVADVDINPSLVIFSDNAKIHQLYLNIIGNANKFTENGTISVRVNAKEGECGIVDFSTVVQDSGVGIKQSDLDKIFEPYYRGVLNSDIENVGAGLGLSLCKEIIELFSGTISVKSEINRGTAVSFNIKLNRDYGTAKL